MLDWKMSRSLRFVGFFNWSKSLVMLIGSWRNLSLSCLKLMIRLIVCWCSKSLVRVRLFFCEKSRREIRFGLEILRLFLLMLSRVCGMRRIVLGSWSNVLLLRGDNVRLLLIRRRKRFSSLLMNLIGRY